MTLGCDASLDWLDDLEPGHDPCYSHVFLYRGYDLAAAGIWEHDIAPCLLCAPLQADQDPAVILTDEQMHWGRLIHFVCCGNCGTRGPWADSESQALALWNAAHERQRPSSAAVGRLERSVRPQPTGAKRWSGPDSSAPSTDWPTGRGVCPCTSFKARTGNRTEPQTVCLLR